MNLLSEVKENILSVLEKNNVSSPQLKGIYNLCLEIYKNKISSEKEFLNKMLNITSLVILNLHNTETLMIKISKEFDADDYKKLSSIINNKSSSLSLNIKYKEIIQLCIQMYLEYLLKSLNKLPQDVDKYNHLVNNNNKNKKIINYIITTLHLYYSQETINKKEEKTLNTSLQKVFSVFNLGEQQNINNIANYILKGK